MAKKDFVESLINNIDDTILWFHNKKFIILFSTIFLLLGFSLGTNASSSDNNSFLINEDKSSGFLVPSNLFTGSAIEQISPHDWITEDQIHVSKDRIVIDLKNAKWAKFADTNSMDPVIDIGSNAIEIIPESTNDIHLGDIVSYKSKDYGVIIHRVMKIGEDDDGWFCITKGDNNNYDDPFKIRFDQIQRIVVAVIY